MTEKWEGGGGAKVRICHRNRPSPVYIQHSLALTVCSSAFSDSWPSRPLAVSSDKQ